ncbi:hypothetical protein B0J15DRAFT_431084 [Fusarium solani]|uniref:NACHT domain-containing protein n=1 Tax=Fusarium solani TaxID=169388 RepID=A0A9P9K1V2_FUSSL|nr:uncharacterized protein B0J15DRAFT_431084 [Fusarium solani]KAH7237239.1 hypothetical protein B0J15DRAFT_431084 [Fusarium solani]
MDPLASISAAASILGVIQFGGSLLKTVREIHNSTSGLTAENTNVERDCFELRHKAEGLSRFAKNNIQSFPSGEDGEELVRISEKCVKATEEILRSLDHVRDKQLKIQHQQSSQAGSSSGFVPGQKADEVKRRKLKTLRQALKAVWKNDEAAKALQTLSDLRGQLELHILSVVQKAQATSSVLDDYRFQALQKSNQDLIQKILENRDIFAEEIRSRVDALWEKTESSLVQAIARIDERIPSSQEIEAAVQRVLLKCLRFASISQRYEEVAEAHRSTFEWIFKADKSDETAGNSFPQWLEHGNGVYWLSGKAASGKSTLIRYILDSGRAYEFLGRWASGHDLEVFSFFFWNSGTPEQRSLLGIFRSILHQYLSKYPEQLQTILSCAYDDVSRYQVFKQHTPNISWTVGKLEDAFEKLIKSTSHQRLCLFIDGLDEYQGDHAAMARFLVKVGTHSHVKICVSSRPWLQIENVFKSCPTLRLQDLTKNDIFVYVEDRLSANENWTALCAGQPSEATKVIKEIVATANGVFLWVKLLLNSLIKGLDLDDDFEDVAKRLRCLPRGLEDLYSHMLKTIDPPFYLEEAAMFFEILRTARQSQELAMTKTGGDEWSGGVMSITTLALADRKNHKLFGQNDSVDSSKGFITSLCRKTDNRLKSRCMGLLEVNGAHRKPYENHTVSYIHRTLRDFLERPDVRVMIQDAIKDDRFSPSLSLARSYVFQIQLALPHFKTSPSPGVWQSTQVAMRYASITERKHTSQVESILHQLDLMMGEHQKKYDTSDYHWSTESLLHGSDESRSDREDDTFLSFCIQRGVYNYVRSILQQNDGLANGKKGRPLLDYAVSSLIDEPHNDTRCRMCKLLLEHGASPNEIHKDVSPWAKLVLYLARNRALFDDDSLTTQTPAWLDLVTLFISRKASLTITVTDQRLGESMTARQILEDTFLLNTRRSTGALKKVLEEHSREDQTEQLSPRSPTPLLNTNATALDEGDSEMSRGWLALEEAHRAARPKDRRVQTYGTFERSEATTENPVFLAILWSILCCGWSG